MEHRERSRSGQRAESSTRTSRNQDHEISSVCLQASAHATDFLDHAGSRRQVRYFVEAIQSEEYRLGREEQRQVLRSELVHADVATNVVDHILFETRPLVLSLS